MNRAKYIYPIIYQVHNKIDYILHYTDCIIQLKTPYI